MNIKHKIKLVEVLRLRPADLEFLNSVPLSEECLAALMNENCELLEKELDGIINKDDLDEKTRLVAASLKTHLQWTSASDAIDKVCEKMVADDFDEFDDSPVEDTWENKMFKEKQGNPKEREKAFKEGKKLIKELPKEDLTRRYCDFIMQKYPELKDGFDNGLYRMGMSDYHEFIGINGKEYLLPTDLNQKLYYARRGVMDGLNKMIDDIYISNLDYWKTEYKCWLEQRHETRITKKSLKLFFEERGKKLSDKVLDKMKMEL